MSEPNLRVDSNHSADHGTLKYSSKHFSRSIHTIDHDQVTPRSRSNRGPVKRYSDRGPFVIKMFISFISHINLIKSSKYYGAYNV